DDDDRRVVPREPLLDVGAHLVDVERPLGDEDDVGATGEAGVQRDPSGVSTHHFYDEHAVVGLGRGVQPVDRLDGDLPGGVEADGVVGGVEVVVDGLRYADDPKAVLGELSGHSERVLAADGDQPVDPERRQRLLDLLDAAVDLDGVRAGRT